MRLGGSLMRGSIKFYAEDRDFGFIKEDGGSDVFFHRTKLLDVDALGLPEGGEAVEYSVLVKGERVCAINIKRIYGQLEGKDT
jgi:cold shock CspA family protein